MVAFYVAVVSTFVFMFWLCLYLFEVNNGPKLDEQVTVKRRNYKPSGVMYVGSGIMPTPAEWSLSVANKNGSGNVRVSQTMYESTHEGDTIRVKGTHGRSNKKWYLREAHKER
ncbi:MAG: hypothetical protein EOP06_11515 [Proteobacteria bacterium]|nr:MAG: hypothetical protein EOP06_11515 [Pseudomonadota bacterium]